MSPAIAGSALRRKQPPLAIPESHESPVASGMPGPAMRTICRHCCAPSPGGWPNSTLAGDGPAVDCARSACHADPSWHTVAHFGWVWAPGGFPSFSRVICSWRVSERRNCLWSVSCYVRVMNLPSTSLPPTALRYLLANSLSIGLLASTQSAAACEVDADCGFGFACIHESVGADSGGTSGSITGGSGGTSSTICDNGTCEFGESFDTCPEDCDEVTSCQPAVCETNDDCAEGYECTLVGGSTATNGSGGIITETFYECRAEVVRCTTDDECAEGETCQVVSSSSGTSAATGSGGAQSATSVDAATSGSDGTDGGSESDSAGTDTTASGGSAGIGGSGGSSGAGQGGSSSELGYCTTDWDSSGGSGGTDAGSSSAGAASSTDASGSTSRGDATGNSSTTGGSATASSGSGGTQSAGQGGSEGDASGSDATSATGVGNQSTSSASSDGSGNAGDSNADGDSDDDGGWSCAMVGRKATTRSHLGALGALGFSMLGGLFRRRRQGRC